MVLFFRPSDKRYSSLAPQPARQYIFTVPSKSTFLMKLFSKCRKSLIFEHPANLRFAWKNFPVQIGQSPIARKLRSSCVNGRNRCLLHRSKTAFIASSTVIPFLSASKFKMTRCLKTGYANINVVIAHVVPALYQSPCLGSKCQRY